MSKNALTRNFNYGLDQRSPALGELSRVEKHLNDGSTVVSYEPTDFDAIRSSFGSIDDWSLNALKKAGVNPDFPIHTSAPSRMESVAMLQDLVARGNALLDSLSSESPVESPVEPSETE